MTLPDCVKIQLDIRTETASNSGIAELEITDQGTPRMAFMVCFKLHEVLISYMDRSSSTIFLSLEEQVRGAKPLLVTSGSLHCP